MTVGDKKWHGKNRNKIDKLKKKVRIKLRKLNKSRNIRIKVQKSILLGCVFHAIEDWYAHSYVIAISEYRKNYKNYSDNSPEAKFHDDRVLKKNKKTGKMELKMDGDIHKAKKDNIYRDFVNGDWKKISKKSDAIQENGRIQEAIQECRNYFRRIK